MAKEAGEQQEVKLGVGSGVWAASLGILYAGISVIVFVLGSAVIDIDTWFVVWTGYLLFTAVFGFLAFAVTGPNNWKGFDNLWFVSTILALILALVLGGVVAGWLSPQYRALGTLVAILVAFAFFAGMLGITAGFWRMVKEKIGHDPEGVKAFTTIAVLVFLVLMVSVSYFTVQNQGIKFQQQDIQILSGLQGNCIISEDKVSVNLPSDAYLYIHRQYKLEADGKPYAFGLKAEREITATKVFDGKKWKNEITNIIYSFPVESAQTVRILVSHPFVATISAPCVPR